MQKIFWKLTEPIYIYSSLKQTIIQLPNLLSVATYRLYHALIIEFTAVSHTSVQ